MVSISHFACMYIRIVHTNRSGIFLEKNAGGGILKLATLQGGGGLAMYPSSHTQGGMIHLRGGEVPPLPPSKKNPDRCTYVRMYIHIYVCMYVCMYVQTYVCTYVCT